MSNQIVGTPDWQRGVVGTQKLLAELVAGDNAVTVGVPPNSEAVLIIVSGTGPFIPGFTVTGNQSGATYSAYRVPREIGGESSIFVVTVSPTIDQTITIGTATAPTTPWSVVSESAGRFVLDMSTAATIGNVDDPVGTSGLIVMGEDQFGSAQFVTVDSSHRLITGGATLYTGMIGVPVGAVMVLPGLVSGHYYLYHAELMNTASVPLALNIEDGGGTIIAATTVPAQDTISIDLDRLAIFQQVNAVGGGVGGYISLRYDKGY